MKFGGALVLLACGCGSEPAMVPITAPSMPTLSPELATLPKKPDSIFSDVPQGWAKPGASGSAKPGGGGMADFALDSPRATVELRVGGHAVEIAFKPGTDGFVKALHDGAANAEIATPALRMAGVGRGNDLVLVSHEQLATRAYALFAAVTRGSPECGSYGFWALRVDAKGVWLTPAIEGCFLSVGGGHPKITWSNPAMLVVESPQYQSGASIEVFTLDEASFVFRSRVQAKVPD